MQTVSGGNMELNAASEREVFEVKGNRPQGNVLYPFTKRKEATIVPS